MVIDSLSPFIPRTPPAEGLNPPIAMPDEQTPLLDTAKVVEGEMPSRFAFLFFL